MDQWGAWPQHQEYSTSHIAGAGQLVAGGGGWLTGDSNVTVL